MSKGGGGGGGGKKGGGGRKADVGGGGAVESPEVMGAGTVGAIDYNVTIIDGDLKPPQPGGVFSDKGVYAQDQNPKKVEAIHAYTGGYVEGGDRFTGINAEKLNESLYAPGSTYGMPAEYKAQLKNYESELNRELNLLKSYKGETYRIVRDNSTTTLSFMDQGKIASKFEPGKLHHFKEFLSTSKTPESLFNYNKARSQVRFKIHGKSGKHIDAVSKYKGAEDEVLFGSGKNFMINSKKWNTKNKTWDIEMTEI